MIARRIVFSGRVQGVGFRQTTRSLASGFPVGGFVRNLPDGDVELVVEGAANDVDRFLAAIERQMTGYIEHRHATDDTVQNHSGFTIRH